MGVLNFLFDLCYIQIYDFFLLFLLFRTTFERVFIWSSLWILRIYSLRLIGLIFFAVLTKIIALFLRKLDNVNEFSKLNLKLSRTFILPELLKNVYYSWIILFDKLSKYQSIVMRYFWVKQIIRRHLSSSINI